MILKIVSLALLFSSFCLSQVYEVTPGTKENKVILSIINESKNQKMEKVKILCENNLTGIELKNSSVEVGELKNGETKEIEFSFDAKRIPGAKTDTLRFVIFDGGGYCLSKQINIKYSVPKDFKLEQNYPNPFNPITTIEYSVPVSGRCSISVFNVIGQLVATLFDGEIEAGYYKTVFNGSRLSSGIYYYRMKTDETFITKKMVLLK